MIRLENIQKIGNIISTKVITVENHPQTFEIEVDVNEKRLVKNTLNKVDFNVGMAMGKLVKLYQEYGDNIPDIEESIWY